MQMSGFSVVGRTQSRSASADREERNATILLGKILGLTLIGVATLVLLSAAYLPSGQRELLALEQMPSYP
jgi:hypothetical protein